MYAIFYPTTSMYFKLFSSKSQTSNPRVVPSHTTCSCQAKTDVRDVKWPPVDLQHFLTVKKTKLPSPAAKITRGKRNGISLIC